MDNTETTMNDAVATPVAPETKAPVAAAPFVRKPFAGAPAGRGGFSSGDRARNPRRNMAARPERIKPEFDQKILNIRRVTRVTTGGKRLNFSVYMVVGDKKGSVGVGTGKANDTSLAIDKAYRSAKKNIVHLNLTKSMSISHDVSAKYSSGRVQITPAPGRGVSAGSAVKSVIELAGINDVTAKIVSPSKNKLNIARATIQALSAFDKKKFTPRASKEDAKAATEVK